MADPEEKIDLSRGDLTDQQSNAAQELNGALEKVLAQSVLTDAVRKRRKVVAAE